MSDRAFSWPSRGRIPTLDGLRALSIGLVLSAHSIGTGFVPMNTRLATLLGDVGVRCFFVLSGFLITTLLVRESRWTGGVSLVRFYLRRACRIFPAFYAYLLVAGLLAAAGVLAFHDGDLLAAATYTTNFHTDRAWSMGHLWSLAVEEQFYIVWPLALVALGLLRAWWFALGAMLAAPLVRIAVWRMLPEYRDLVDQAFPCVFDALATGCLLALAMPRLAGSATAARLLDSRWFWLLPVVAAALLGVRNPWVRHGVAMTVANVAIAAVILRCVARPSGRIGRLLERRPLVWVGTMSYSLYLWQQLFMNRHADAWLCEFPLNVICAMALAVASHYVIERPFLQLNTRWRAAPPVQQAPELALLEPSSIVIDVSNVRKSGIVHSDAGVAPSVHAPGA